MKINTFRGDLTDNSAKKEALVTVSRDELVSALEAEEQKREAIRALKEEGKASSDSSEKQAINSRVQAEVKALKALSDSVVAIKEQYVIIVVLHSSRYIGSFTPNNIYFHH